MSEPIEPLGMRQARLLWEHSEDASLRAPPSRCRWDGYRVWLARRCMGRALQWGEMEVVGAAYHALQQAVLRYYTHHPEGVLQGDGSLLPVGGDGGRVTRRRVR
jgi:hypothetical protein